MWEWIFISPIPKKIYSNMLGKFFMVDIKFYCSLQNVFSIFWTLINFLCFVLMWCSSSVRVDVGMRNNWSFLQKRQFASFREKKRNFFGNKTHSCTYFGNGNCPQRGIFTCAIAFSRIEIYNWNEIVSLLLLFYGFTGSFKNILRIE